MDGTSTPTSPPAGSGLRIPETSPSTTTTASTISNQTIDTVDTEVVDSPVSPSSTDALARFEFEAGRGNEGSKILMVEWNPSPIDSGSEPTPEELLDQDGWVVTWEGKKTSSSVSEKDDDTARLRVYFLLPSDVTIPPVVTISHTPTGRTLITKSMPAIFAPGLGISTQDAGKRGVLHTIWAKKRVAQLQEEIRKELLNNSEGVALEMAVQERQWLIDHFGLVDPHAAERPAQPPPTPQSPRSPIGGRLGEKLKGLKLATSPTELSNASGINSRHVFQPILPETASTSASSRSALPPRAPVPTPGSGSVVASLNAIVDSSQPAAPPISQSKETEDELFALPMSPRSPEMKTSPFSFLR
ncbi:hypothetical protein F5B20DRAFT_583904 [Whalleya microplaca]|nr:hypothetical protein F5B20DRAFT_583904 [Whalleya microplaca]